MKPENDQHPTEMLLDYLEDALSSEDKAQVNAHLEQCQECAEHLEEIKIITTGLRTHKEAFCPEPEELLSFVRTGEDPESRVADHLDQCPSCRGEVESYKEATVNETMSPRVREAFESLTTGSAGDRRLADRLSEFIYRLKGLFDVPTMAFGAAVAAVLVLVVAYPGGEKSSMIALSSVEWKSTLARPKSLLHEEQPYAAIVIMLKGSRTLDKDTVNSLYISLSPTREMRKKYRFRSPAQVTKVMTENKIDPADRKAILRSLHKEFKVAEVLVITVTSEGDRFHIAYQLVNSKTGATQRSTDLADVNEGDLKARFAGPAFALLEGKDRGR